MIGIVVAVVGSQVRRHCARGGRWELMCELHLLVVAVVIVVVAVVLRRVHIWDSLVDILRVVQVS